MVRVKADCIDVTTFRPKKYPPQALSIIKGLTTPYFVRTLFCYAGEHSRRLRKYPIEGYKDDVLMFAGSSNKPHHLELPRQYLQGDDDNKIQPFVTMQGCFGGVTKVKLRIDNSDSNRLGVDVAQGWPRFCRNYALRQGDLLLFSVVAKSTFVVSVFSQEGNLLAERRPLPPRPNKIKKCRAKVAGSTKRKPKKKERGKNQQETKRRSFDFNWAEVIKQLEEPLEEPARTIGGQRVESENLKDQSKMSIDRCRTPDIDVFVALNFPASPQLSCPSVPTVAEETPGIALDCPASPQLSCTSVPTDTEETPGSALDFPASPQLNWLSVSTDSEEPLWSEEPMWEEPLWSWQ